MVCSNMTEQIRTGKQRNATSNLQVQRGLGKQEGSQVEPGLGQLEVATAREMIKNT